nr:MAG TPA: cytotoxic protein [Caudoviricetes sp.]
MNYRPILVISNKGFYLRQEPINLSDDNIHP